MRFFIYLVSTFFFCTTLVASPAASDSEIVVEPEFTSFWSDKMNHFYKKGTYSDIPESISSQLLYKNHPIRIEAEFEGEAWFLFFYDDQDPLLELHKKPCLFLGCDKEDSQDPDYFLDWVETDNLSLKDVVALALYFKNYCKMEEFKYLDLDVTYRCPYDGTYCSSEALMLKRAEEVVLSGSSFYEKLGAKPYIFEKGYKKAAAFLNQLKIEDLIHDIGQVFPKSTANQMNNHLKSFKNGSGLTSTDVTIGEIAQKLKEKSTQSKQAHLLWHEFHDRILAYKQNNATMFIHALMKNPSNLHTSLMKGLGFILYFETNWYFDELIGFAQYEYTKKTPDMEFIKEVQNLAKHFPDNLSRAMQLYCKKRLEWYKDINLLPSFTSLILRADETSILKHIAFYIPIEGLQNSKQIYIDTANALVNQLSKEGAKSLDLEVEFLKALKDYENNPSESKPGTVYALWIYSKWLVGLSNGFEFED